MEENYKKHASHEAAHCISGWYKGLKIDSVTIIGGGKPAASPYRTVIQGAAMLGVDKLTLQDVKDRCFIYMASGVIESQGNGGKPGHGGLYDVFELMNFLTWRDPGAAFLSEKARESFQKFPDNWEQAALDFFSNHKEPVEDFFDDPKVQKSLEALTAKILEKGHLSGFEVVSILEDTWTGPLPEKARPRSEHSSGMNTLATPQDAMTSAKRLLELGLELLGQDDPLSERGRKILLNAFFQMSEIKS